MIYAVEGRKSCCSSSLGRGYPMGRQYICTLCAVCKQYLYWWYLGGAKNAREGEQQTNIVQEGRGELGIYNLGMPGIIHG